MINTRGSERKTDRLEAFSDAVLAIAITLPLVDLKAPGMNPTTSLATQYAALGPAYLSYGASFIVIGVYWAYSHFSGKLWRKTDHGFNLLTLLFLGAVSVTPFPSRPFIEHVGDPVNIRTAASVYAWMLSAPAVLWTVRWFYGVHRGLLDPHLDPRFIRGTGLKYAATAMACIVGASIATAGDWRLGIAIVGLVTCVYLLPPMTPRYRAGEEPADDTQEADERPASGG